MIKANILVRETQFPFLRDATLVLCASFVLALFAKLAIPLPFTPVPIATQSLIVLLLAGLLGARRAGAAVFAFLVQGALGLPVFAHAMGGIAVFCSPRGGYLIGYLVAAFVTGWLIERRSTFWATAGALTAGTLLIYLFGASWLATMVGFKKAILLGVVPFLVGDALKVFICLKILRLRLRG